MAEADADFEPAAYGILSVTRTKPTLADRPKISDLSSALARWRHTDRARR
jgi:hypothetical protein